MAKHKREGAAVQSDGPFKVLSYFCFTLPRLFIRGLADLCVFYGVLKIGLASRNVRCHCRLFFPLPVCGTVYVCILFPRLAAQPRVAAGTGRRHRGVRSATMSLFRRIIALSLRHLPLGTPSLSLSFRKRKKIPAEFTPRKNNRALERVEIREQKSLKRWTVIVAPFFNFSFFLPFRTSVLPRLVQNYRYGRFYNISPNDEVQRSPNLADSQLIKFTFHIIIKHNKILCFLLMKGGFVFGTMFHIYIITFFILRNVVSKYKIFNCTYYWKLISMQPKFFYHRVKPGIVGCAKVESRTVERKFKFKNLKKP